MGYNLVNIRIGGFRHATVIGNMGIGFFLDTKRMESWISETIGTRHLVNGIGLNESTFRKRYKKSHYYIMLFALLSTLLVAYASVQDDLLLAMKNELANFDTVMPTNTLVTDITTDHSYSLRTTSTENLLDTLTSWTLPKDVTVQMEMAAYATSEQFQSMSFVDVNHHTDYEQYIVSAKHVNDTITLAYIHAHITSSLVPQYTTVHVRSCHRCWLVAKCCRSATEHIPRGLTPTELETVFTILQATAYETLVHAFPTHDFLHYQELGNVN
jgi:hypothetical protein